MTYFSPRDRRDRYIAAHGNDGPRCPQCRCFHDGAPSYATCSAALKIKMALTDALDVECMRSFAHAGPSGDTDARWNAAHPHRHWRST
jgi:hypothetical protein